MKNVKVYKISNGEKSTLTGMNGGDIESPDGSMIVYAAKPDLDDPHTELWGGERDRKGRRRGGTVS